MYYGEIKKFDIADGEGVRVTLFVSGCTNCCEGCFQPQTWNFTYGKEYTSDTEKEILDALGNDFIQGLTLLGGEPFEPDNQRELVKLLRKVKDVYPEKDIWSYTGFVFDKDLLEGQRKHTEVTDEMLSYIDVLVDGPFILSKKNIRLKFRGSENQRVLNMNETLKQKTIVKYLD